MKVIQARLTDLEYQQLIEWQNYRNKLQEDEGIKYSISDLIRIGLSWGERIENYKTIISLPTDQELDHNINIIQCDLANFFKEYKTPQEAIKYAIEITAKVIRKETENN